MPRSHHPHTWWNVIHYYYNLNIRFANILFCFYWKQDLTKTRFFCMQNPPRAAVIQGPTDQVDGVYGLDISHQKDKIWEEPHLQNPEIDGSPRAQIPFGALRSLSMYQEMSTPLIYDNCTFSEIQLFWAPFLLLTTSCNPTFRPSDIFTTPWSSCLPCLSDTIFKFVKALAWPMMHQWWQQGCHILKKIFITPW